MPDRPRRQLQRSQATREAIVTAAMGVFALKGFDAASMDDVRLAAGCSKGGIYHHFGGKPALLAAVVERLASTGSLLPVAGRPGAPARLLLEVWSQAARSPELQARLRACYDATTGGLQLPDVIDIGNEIEALTRRTTAEPEQVEEAA